MSVYACKAGAGNAPAGMTIVTTVMAPICFLEALHGAGRAARSFVEPVAVGVQGVFYVVSVYGG